MVKVLPSRMLVPRCSADVLLLMTEKQILGDEFKVRSGCLMLDFLLSLAVPTLNGSIRRPGNSVPGTQIPRSDLFQVPV